LDIESLVRDIIVLPRVRSTEGLTEVVLSVGQLDGQIVIGSFVEGG
jgi:hypothetical protein